MDEMQTTKKKRQRLFRHPGMDLDVDLILILLQLIRIALGTAVLPVTPHPP